MTGRLLGGVFLAFTLSCATASVALAQSAPENAHLPKLSDIEPIAVAKHGIRNIKLTVEQSLARSQNVGQPTDLDQTSWQTSLGISADLGQYFGIDLTGTFSRENIKSTNTFGMPIEGSGNVLGVDTTLTWKPAEFLHVGVLAGVGGAGASYDYLGIGYYPSADSSSRRLGAFLSAFYRADRLVLSGNLTVLNASTDVTYSPGNMPATNSFGATMLLSTVGASYALTEDLRVTGGVTLNTVLSQVVAAGETGLDNSWATIGGGLEYDITPQFSINAKASTWLFNERMNHTRFAVGAAYRF